MESPHELLNTGGVVPIVDVEQVDVRRPQFLERRLDIEVERLRIVATIEHLLRDLVVVVLRTDRVLCSEEELVAVTPSLRPLANNLFRGFFLAAIQSPSASARLQTCSMRHLLPVRRIDPIPSHFKVRIKHLEATLLIHCAHTLVFPLIPKAHPTKADGGDMDTSEVTEPAVDTEFGLGSGEGCEKRCHFSR